MSEWLLNSISSKRSAALKIANRVNLSSEFSPFEKTLSDSEISLLTEVLNMLELFLDHQEIACDAFKLRKILPLPTDDFSRGFHLLHTATLGILSDKASEASNLLKAIKWPQLPLNSSDWRERTYATIIEIYLRLIKKSSWEDRDIVLDLVAALRQGQKQHEETYLENCNREAALELIGLYHLTKAAEIMALYITEGVVEGNYQVKQLLDAQFDRAVAICENSQLLLLEPLVRLLSRATLSMVNNSIWSVTRAVNTKVSQFVKSLVTTKALFEVLPPQRVALAEQGLLGSSRRAVVVSLPTSSGKTLIAEFRILQALNQFDFERGWVAYLAPTRALVNQVARQLRSDFADLSIIVEQVSPALELDTVEDELLRQEDKKTQFRVLVTTPEKLDLMLKQGWEEKIKRPLTLVVVDEAHTIQDPERGLKLELLLATINKECKNAQFLLLTPFISNAAEVATWLGEESSQDISLSVEWQPNERAIGIVTAEKRDLMGKRSYDYNLEFRPIHTSKKTLLIDEKLTIAKVEKIAKTYSQANEQKNISAIAAQFFQKRGVVIILYNRIDWLWSFAEQLKMETNREKEIDSDIVLLQKFLEAELGEDFPLIDLLNYGIGVHHSGLPEEVRILIEWLAGRGKLKFVVATTTIAQGINFPVDSVVIANHQYYRYSENRSVEMPPEDFWNIVGRAGRVYQNKIGLVALAATTKDKVAKLESFINRQTDELNSALIALVMEAKDKLSNLGKLLNNNPAWSNFLQYLAHTYTQMGKPEGFALEVEQVLRGTFGFQKLREKDAALAKSFQEGVESYIHYLERSKSSLGFVDSTGFSLDSVNRVLAEKRNITSTSWDEQSLYAPGNQTLKEMMGILLSIPELRKNLKVIVNTKSLSGGTLAALLKDWVAGKTVPEIASNYFGDTLKDLTKCGRNLFGGLTQTASWGLSALLTITGSDLEESEREKLNNLPAMAYYGVNSDDAILFRLLGVPRTAANSIAKLMREHIAKPLPLIRKELNNLSDKEWNEAMGSKGSIYHRVYRIVEGLD